MSDAQTDLKVTPLNSLHKELGGKMVPFAGYEMPVQYADGILTEHNHTREAAGLFDVSHMGQVIITGDNPAAALESLIPGDIQILKPGRMRYSSFTNDQGGILDDLMITKREDDLFLVVNAACKDQDVAHMREKLAGKAEVTVLEDRALLALQGPKAAKVLARLSDDVADMPFLSGKAAVVAGFDCLVNRCGYTGEDGYEISVKVEEAEALARKLLAEEEVKPIGLGARDTLRLEAGLCLYGHDIDTTTTPIEANLTWTVNKRRREEGEFPGADVILKQIAEGTDRKLVGIKPEGRAPTREGTIILDADGAEIGTVTSGGFAPTVGGPIAMGYVPAALAAEGSALQLQVRKKIIPATVVKLPFVPHRYFK